MEIGIISDTHDNIPNIIKATNLFKRKKVKLVLHIGDIIAPVTIKFFKGLNIKFVKGNCDGDIETIQKKIKEIDGEYLGEIGELDLEDKKLILFHGKPQEKLQELIESQKYDYLLTGHTHILRDERIGKTRIINPSGHYLDPEQKEHKIAILDLKNDKVEFIKVN